MKNPGESVRANEAVVQLGNLYRLAADAYVPLEFAFRVKEGQVVEIQPRITSGQGRAAADREEAVPGQDHLRRSRRSSRSPRRPSGSAPSSRIPTGELRPGLKVQMTVFLNSEVAAAGPDGAAPTQTARNQ